MQTLRQQFIQNLKFFRKQNGMRQLDLALEIGKSSNYINSIENGKYFPSPETIESIARSLGIEPVRLFVKCEESEKEKLPAKLEKELLSESDALKSRAKGVLVPVVINEYDMVELLVEEER